jgi:nucleoid-associated protein YgaU
MQTMPSKNRSSMMLTGIALLVLVVGLIAYGLNSRAKHEAKPADPMAEVAEPENGIAAQPGAKVDGAGPTPDAGTTAHAAPAANTPAVTAEATAEAKSRGEATTALTALGSVPETHVVQPGETLYSISMKYYNNQIYAGDIEELNGISDPNRIQVGMELKLPRPEELTMMGAGH